MNHSIHVAMLDQVELIREASDQIAIEAPANMRRPRIVFKQVTRGLHDALERIHQGGSSVPFLIAKIMQTDGMAGVSKLNHYLVKLGQHALLAYDLFVGDDPFVSLVPLTSHFKYTENKVKPDNRYVLSKFAYCRNDRGEMVLNSPLSYGELRLRHQDAMTAIHRLSNACTSYQMAETVCVLDDKSALAFMNFLANTEALCRCNDQSVTPEDTDPVLGQWAFHDLLFHNGSRLGRHSDPYGGTFPFKDKFKPLPLVKPAMSKDIVDLYQPDMESLKNNEIPFSRVLEERQSLRGYGRSPITLKQLGAFLYRSARIKKMVEADGVSWRPSPGGGAIHALEIYPVVNRCQDLPSGLYHYNPLDHCLARVHAPQDFFVQTLLDMAAITGKLEESPQVLMVITARFQRIQIKYQSVAYSVMLKDVGCLYQTMYLVATAMGLAPCALGGGDSDLFAAAAGVDYYAETSVGEFLIGSGPAARPDRLQRPKGVDS